MKKEILKTCMVICATLLFGTMVFAQNTTTDYQIPMQQPPGNLPVHTVPQFVTIGFDDNSFPAGVDWAVQTLAGGKRNPEGSFYPKTYDGEPISFSFYNATSFAAQAGNSWKAVYDEGIHEIGNHTDAHFHGENADKQKWIEEITKCENILKETFGVSELTLSGFRAPYLEYENAMYEALIEKGYLYDCSIEEGFDYGLDGTNNFWPYTLDNGSPGHELLWEWGAKKFLLNSHKGIWELPVYNVIVPPDEECAKYGIQPGLRRRCKALQSWFDIKQGKITGYDYNMLYSFRMNRAEFGGVLKYTLDLRLQGNRCPMTLGAHSEYYSGVKNPPMGLDASRGGLEDFVNYALTKQPVRIVSAKKTIDWIRSHAANSGINLALNKDVIISSEVSPPNQGIHAVDGDRLTSWSTQQSDNPEYIAIDLGAPREIRGIALTWNGDYYASDYCIYFSNDGVNWQWVYETLNNNGHRDEIIGNKYYTTRYIGIYMTRKPSTHYDLAEFEVIGR